MTPDERERNALQYGSKVRAAQVIVLKLSARGEARSFGHGTGLRPVPAIPGTGH